MMPQSISLKSSAGTLKSIALIYLWAGFFLNANAEKIDYEADLEKLGDQVQELLLAKALVQDSEFSDQLSEDILKLKKKPEWKIRADLFQDSLKEFESNQFVLSDAQRSDQRLVGHYNDWVKKRKNAIKSILSKSKIAGLQKLQERIENDSSLGAREKLKFVDLVSKELKATKDLLADETSLLSSIPFQSETAKGDSEIPESERLQIPSNRIKKGDAYYFAAEFEGSKPVTFREAAAEARRYGGRLYAAASKEEMAFVTERIHKRKKGMKLWIGIVGQDDQFQSADGKKTDLDLDSLGPRVSKSQRRGAVCVFIGQSGELRVVRDNIGHGVNRALVIVDIKKESR